MECRYFRVTTVLASLSIVFMHHIDASMNQLQKVFHHKGSFSEKAKSIELGVIDFYFAQKPEFTTLQLPDTKLAAGKMVSKNIGLDGMQKLVILFPKASIADDSVKGMISAINHLDGVQYKARLEWVKKPTDGLKFTVTYDPAKVNYKYSWINKITDGRQQQGVSFHFYNQELLTELSSKSNRNVLNVAWVKNISDVIIDCGHGGDDAGAIGFAHIKEKDIALAVGMQVAEGLKKKGFNVAMTRDADFFVPLDERTTFANNVNHPALFLSIHANASVDKNSHGIETYYFDPQLLQEGVSFLNNQSQKIVLQQEKFRSNHSKLLAQLTHNSLLKAVSKENALMIDRSIHPAVLQVLLGATMPAALIEIGFVSNPAEAKLLSDVHYQQCIAQGICNGVVSYFNTTRA